MTIEYAFFLALIQGLTEFLPISSSAHLILPSAVFGWPDQGLAFDVAVHFGSLGAVILSLRIEIQRVATGMLIGMGRRYPRHAKLGWLIGLATLPAVIAGVLAKDFIETELRSELVIAWATIGFGLLLWWAHYQSGRGGFAKIRVRDALIIGLAQALALIPGTSRSGITLTAGLWLGLSRRVAAKFSFLLSIPIIFGAALIKTGDLIQTSNPVAWDLIAIGVLVSFLSAYLCIGLFLALIQRVGLLPFVAYRLALGLILLVLLVWHWPEIPSDSIGLFSGPSLSTEIEEGFNIFLWLRYRAEFYYLKLYRLPVGSEFQIVSSPFKGIWPWMSLKWLGRVVWFLMGVASSIVRAWWSIEWKESTPIQWSWCISDPSVLLNINHCARSMSLGWLIRVIPARIFFGVSKIKRQEVHLAPKVLQMLALSHFRSANPVEKLSLRELTVYDLVIEGSRAPDIFQQLSVSANTINTYRYRIFENLGIASDIELTHLAYNHRIKGVES